MAEPKGRRLPSGPKGKKTLGDRMRDIADGIRDGIDEALDGLGPQPQPIPIPVKGGGRRPPPRRPF